MLCGACFVDACFANNIEDAACYMDEFKLSFQGASFTFEEDSVSMEIIVNDINIIPPPKKKKMEIAQ